MGADVIELDSPPSLTPMLARVGLRALPLPGLGRGSRDVQTLPDTRVVLRGATVDSDDVAAYAAVCGFRRDDVLPVTYLHLLGFPLSVALMTRPDFPFGLLGMVHIRNTITAHRSVGRAEVVDVSASVGDLRPHPKGVQMANRVSVSVGEEVVWESTSTYLKRGSGAAPSDDGGEAGRADEVDVGDLSLTARWRVAADAGRRYAAVSGDRNPIHLSALSARAFGFPRAIAHGMWTKARCLAGLEGRLPAACTVDVAFKLPLLLPATVEYATAAVGDGGWLFGVRGRDGKPHLAGAVHGIGDALPT